jgi:hypothetical protein
MLRTAILNYVREVQGCKITELCAVEHLVIAAIEEKTNLGEVVYELIEEGSLISIDYILSNMTYRMKTFVLPAKTRVVIPDAVKVLETELETV